MDIANLILDYIKVLVWPAAALVFLLMYRDDLSNVIRRVKSVPTPAGTIEFVEEARVLLDQAEAKARVAVSPSTRRGALRRLEHATDVLQGGKLLWVDDHPAHNRSLIKLFRAAGMEVDTAVSTGEALTLLRRHAYDLILSDIGRDDDQQAGTTMLRDLERLDIDTPVVLYTFDFDYDRGFPSRAFAATDVPDEVVHYVIDLMERAKLS
ncbi:response regulator [Streptomyces sp. NPDC001380]|uniref:response regulator n=1 Tax=Streptomyces sp. NPDC001380 TaxID=3364566 RepID=UPI0036BE3869